MYRLLIHHDGRWRKDWRQIPPAERPAVVAAIDGLATAPYAHPPRQKKLTRSPLSEYRLRQGRWRVFYDVHEEQKVVLLIAVRRRSEVTYR